MKRLNYNHTVYCCFVSYIVQAVVNNFAPLLFITFMTEYSISLKMISLLITINFGVQLIVDLLSAPIVRLLGYRGGVVFAHIMSALGLICLGILPELFETAYLGLVISIIIYAIGGGMIEVIISPMVEACPTDNKQTAMGLLHSFYCWGSVAVILISTVFFALFGTENRLYITLFWALLPIVNVIFFLFVPISRLNEESGDGLRLKELFKCRTFYAMLILMLCAGASEQAVSQWASAFSETGLKVSKTVGDLLGPMLFSILMGLSRVFYAKMGEKIKLEKYMMLCGGLCVIGYLMSALAPISALGFVGCALCGIAVGVMWPGTYSLAMKYMPKGTLLLFSFLALAGDVGCTTGPAIVGVISDLFSGNLKLGILIATVFPVLLTLTLIVIIKRKNACR